MCQLEHLKKVRPKIGEVDGTISSVEYGARGP